MPQPPATERLRLTPRSVVRAVALLGLTLALLTVFAASRRVLGWMVVAALVAALLYPVVGFLARRMPRGLAIAVVVAGVLAIIGVVVYGVIDDISQEVKRLQRAGPRAAREIARSDRFDDLAEEIDLVARVEDFVKEVPRRLQGGGTAAALRSAATRSVAFLATGVLTLFLLVQGPRLVQAAGRQLPEARRVRAERVAANAYRRACRYARRIFVKVVVAGLLTYGLALWAGLPGEAALGVWMGMWAVVPVVGVVLGALPAIILAAVFEPGLETGLLVLAFAGWLAAEILVVQRWVEHDAVRVGPFLTLAVGFVGLEAYGIGGALVGLAMLVAAIAVADELAPA
jgi:predicted PurR-regulated permease PerM